MSVKKLLRSCMLGSLVMVAWQAHAEVKVDPNLKVNQSVKKPAIRNKSNGVSYTYGGLQYISQHLDWTPGCTQDGLQAYGSLYIQNGWFVNAALGDVNGDPCGSSRVAAGGGYRAKFNQQFDMYATLNFETISPDSGDSDSGLILTGGMRGFVANELEGVIELIHSTTFDGTTAVNLGGRYWFSPSLAGTMDLGLSSDYTSIQIGARLNF